MDGSEKDSSEVSCECTRLAPLYERWRGSEDGRMEVWAQAQLLGPNEVRCSFAAPLSTPHNCVAMQPK